MIPTNNSVRATRFTHSMEITLSLHGLMLLCCSSRPSFCETGCVKTIAATSRLARN